MNRILLSLGIITMISTQALAQPTYTDPRCPVIHRNNGNGGGCDSKITLYYPSCPTNNYYVIGILNDDQPLTGYTFTTSPCNNGKVEVCIQGGNMPPIPRLGVIFSNAPNGSLLFVCSRIPSGGSLPVSITTFSGKRNSSSVTLNWKTEFEENVKEFIIERKAGEKFEFAGRIPASNVLTGSSYSFNDYNYSKGATQYRLKAEDLDGSFSYSSIVNVKGTAGATEFFVFPNPSLGNIQINLSDVDAAYEVQVIDNNGRILKTNRVAMGTPRVDFSDLPKGLHMIRVINLTTGERVSQKISVL